MPHIHFVYVVGCLYIRRALEMLLPGLGAVHWPLTCFAYLSRFWSASTLQRFAAVHVQHMVSGCAYA